MGRSSFWICAKMESTIRDGYFEILKKLKVCATKNVGTADLAGLVWEKLQDERRAWLVVFDDVPE